MDAAQWTGTALVAVGILGVALGIELTRGAWTEAAGPASLGQPQSMGVQMVGLTSALLLVLGAMSAVVGGFLLRPADPAVKAQPPTR